MIQEIETPSLLSYKSLWFLFFNDDLEVIYSNNILSRIMKPGVVKSMFVLIRKDKGNLYKSLRKIKIRFYTEVYNPYSLWFQTYFTRVFDVHDSP